MNKTIIASVACGPLLIFFDGLFVRCAQRRTVAMPSPEALRHNPAVERMQLTETVGATEANGSARRKQSVLLN